MSKPLPDLAGTAIAGTSTQAVPNQLRLWSEWPLERKPETLLKKSTNF